MRSKSRRQAREAALQALYTMEVGRGRLADTIKNGIDHAGLEGDQAEFMKSLVTGVFEKQTELDELLAPLVTEWDFERVAAIDRAVLRLATYELYHCPDIPPISSINEAIELAKKFSTAESGKFVNGVLGRVLPLSPKADWEQSAPKTASEPAPEPEPEPKPKPKPADDRSVTESVSLWQDRPQNPEKQD